ncbi:MAG TPA: glycosyl hydrolase 53 family protein [Natronosporangium sp.]
MVRKAFTLAAVVALVAAGLGAPAAGHPAGGTVDNAGFETGSTTGWTERGNPDASFVEAGGQAGTGFRLSHWAEDAYTVTTEQRVTGLRNGHYTLRVWVRTDGGQRSAYVGLRCGRDEQRVALPRTGGSDWVQVAVSARATRHQCTIVLHSSGNPGNWANFDEVTLSRGRLAPVPIRGADVSTLKKNEDFGAVYFDRQGRQRDALSILRSEGMNYARLKVWVNPTDGYNNLDRVLEMARRIDRPDMGLVIDFHYSDRWADPGQQNKPRAWADLSFPELRQAVYDHTYEVLHALRRQGTPADIAQLGNEINGGMLWPDGRWDNWDGLAALLISATEAAHDASPRTKTILHLAEGGNNGGHVWWFDNAIARGVEFDIIGVSHYIYWHGSLGSLQANLFDLTARYGKPIAVMEAAYGFTLEENDSTPNIFNASLAEAGGYPATPEGQADLFRDMFTVVNAVPQALGVFYWEPTWTAVEGAGWDPDDPTSGDGWENQALFDYDGRALPAINVFDH